MSRILIVDDKDENLYMLRALLEGHGYEVDEARHGAEALLRARQTPPDLVISDLLMPVMDGYMLLRRWKTDHALSSIPFVVYTATYTEPRDEKLALDLGADAFLIKPTEPGPFVERVEELLKRQERGLLTPAKEPTGDQAAQMVHYNEALIRKLEEKAIQLERANRALEEEVEGLAEAEEALRASRDLLSSIVEHAPLRIFWKDSDGRYLGCNSAFARDAGLSRPEELIGKDDHEMSWSDVADLYRTDDKNVAESGRPKLNFEEPQVTPDGRTIWLRTSKVPLLDSSGSVVGILGIYDDITEEKEDQTERGNLQAQLVQAQKLESVGRLAGGVAHDFNNMLSVILALSEMAIEQVGRSDPLHADLMEIRNAARKSAEITRQLLAFARKQAVSLQILDLNETVEQILKMLRRLIGEEIELTWVPGSEVWPVLADPSQIDQILANLCVNARDAMEGSGKITIETRNATIDEAFCAGHPGVSPGEYVMLAFADDGSGMAAETLANIFEPFYTTKGVGQGTGLGLSTVYGIVKQNNGFIEVMSEPGEGTTFEVYLPKGPQASTGGETKADKEPPKGHGETILIVEDDQTILNVAERILAGLGYVVKPATTAARALELGGERSGGMDLLLTDVVMPDMNGRDLADRLLEFHPGLRVLFMSGYPEDVIAHRGVLDPGVSFLQKPFSRVTLAHKVREVLERE